MTNLISSLYTEPSCLQQLKKTQQILDSLTKPYLLSQSDTTLKRLSATLDLEASVLKRIKQKYRLITPDFLSPIQNTLETFAKTDFSGAFESVKQYQTMLKDIASPSIQVNMSSFVQDWSHTIFGVTPYQHKQLSLKKGEELSKITETVSKIAETGVSINPPINSAPTLSEEDKKVIEAEVTTIFSDKENWQHRVMQSINRFKQTNPVWAGIIILIVIQILVCVASNLITTLIGQALFPANVYEEPRSSSQVVYHIETNQPVIIVDDVPYYYAVEVKDETTGKIKTGYVSKRSICLCEDNASFESEVED